jgi:hypothetical protein
VNHIVVLGEAHLCRILRAYARYYNDIRTHRAWIKMRRFLARFSGPESLIPTRSLVGFITTMFGFRFSVHTGLEFDDRFEVGQPPNGKVVGVGAVTRARHQDLQIGRRMTSYPAPQKNGP